MPNWTSTFNNSPADTDTPSSGDDKIRETRQAISERLTKEHEHGGSGAADGWHLEGSAKMYYVNTAPTLRPDDTTALDSDDQGRDWVDSDDKSEYVWDGDSWEAVQTVPNNVAIYQDQKSQNTDGGTATSGSFQTRAVNTEIVNNISGASLGTNQILLPAGTYYAEFACPAYYCNDHQAKLYDTTSSANAVLGDTAYANQYIQSVSYGTGDFTLLSSSVMELQHNVDTTRATDGWGRAANAGTEVYSQLLIMKVG